ncbi:MAG TPA: ribosome-associated translation inhibitor RaiA [Candidatus Merdivicinus faecavium]|nr:ribosome-associated translation inhibitor RaiA [Candidatus Merdivicinus faecavium]
MNTVFVARKMTLSDSFKERAEQKLKKLDKFFDDVKAQVTVSSQKEMATVELTVWAGGMIFRAEARSIDKLDALNDAIDNLIRRIRKNKTRLQKKVKASAFELPEEPIPEETDYDVIRTKEVTLRPTHVDEAILQMNMLGHSFFVFLNAESGTVNVVYRRNDGGYGLIVPDR